MYTLLYGTCITNHTFWLRALFLLDVSNKQTSSGTILTDWLRCHGWYPIGQRIRSCKKSSHTPPPPLTLVQVLSCFTVAILPFYPSFSFSCPSPMRDYRFHYRENLSGIHCKKGYRFPRLQPGCHGKIDNLFYSMLVSCWRYLVLHCCYYIHCTM